MSNASFRDLGLSSTLLESIAQKGFEEPSPIQAAVIPLLLENKHDVIGQAQTGTGKTAAFSLPLIERLNPNQKHVQALIIAPTRELALQVVSEINSLKGKKNLTTVAIYGGQSMRDQLRRLEQGVDIVVGTPGRVLDHISRKSLNLDKLDFLILDEADEMLNMGFIEDVEAILAASNPERRILMFSATMPKHLMQIAEKFMKDRKVIATKQQQLTTQLTEQIYFEVPETNKFEALCRIIDVETEFFGVIFVRTKMDADVIANQLIQRGYEAAALHGDIEQKNREKVLAAFRQKKTHILVATDVAARGIDISDLTHVINYALPQNPEAYVHRIGRTGRAGKQGTAITFITPGEYRKLNFIQRITKTEIRRQKLPKAEEVLKIKTYKVQQELENALTGEQHESYHQLSRVLLKQYDPQALVSMLLQLNYGDELTDSAYRDLDDVNPNHQGKTRLFIAKGQKHGMSPKKLIAFIQETAPISASLIRDIQIFEEYSFASVPLQEAEKIVERSKERQRGDLPPMIAKAKEKSDSNKNPEKRRENKQH